MKFAVLIHWTIKRTNSAKKDISKQHKIKEIPRVDVSFTASVLSPEILTKPETILEVIE